MTIAFGKRLRDLRLDRGLSQQELADKLGVDKSYISKLENGKADYPPGDWMFNELGKMFDVSALGLSFLCGIFPIEVIEMVAVELEATLTKAKKYGKRSRIRIGKQYLAVKPNGSIHLMSDYWDVD